MTKPALLEQLLISSSVAMIFFTRATSDGMMVSVGWIVNAVVGGFEKVVRRYQTYAVERQCL